VGLRLAALSLWLRLVQKPRLSRLRDAGELRRSFERVAALAFMRPPGVAEARGAVGGVPCVWQRAPQAAASGTILYLHGGAFIAGSARTHSHLAAHLARRTGLPAVLPEYRLAPEHPFPAAIDDALSVYRGLAVSGPVVLTGDSAGGGLAFGLLVAIRAAGLADPRALAVFSPWADLTLRADSIRRNAKVDAMLPAGRIAEVAAYYLAGADPHDPRASPVLARFTPAPPPAFLAASRCEILADDTVALAAVLRHDGGTVVEHWHATAPHAWPIFAGLLPEADTTLDAAATFLRTALSDRSP
jgi:acetyl esterase/lipase